MRPIDVVQEIAQEAGLVRLPRSDFRLTRFSGPQFRVTVVLKGRSRILAYRQSDQAIIELDFIHPDSMSQLRKFMSGNDISG